MKPVLNVEILLLKSANEEEFVDELKSVQYTVFQSNFDFDQLQKHLVVLIDVIHETLPSVKKVTRIHTIYEAMDACVQRNVFRST